MNVTAVQSAEAIGRTGASELGAFFVALGLLMAVVIGATVVLLIVRSRVVRDQSSNGGGFALSDLRDLYQSGELSREEYEAARQAIIDKVSAEPAADGEAGQRPAPASSMPHEPKGSVRVARPGYDLTGEPLPQKTTDHVDGHDEDDGSGSTRG